VYAHAAWSAWGRLRKALGEKDSFACQGIQIWSLYMGITGGTQPVGPEFIGQNEKYVLLALKSHSELPRAVGSW
jgi:hypothetical protein